MKKTLIVLLIAATMLLAACGTEAPKPDGTALKDGVTLQSLVSGLCDRYEMAAYMEMSGEDLATLLELSPSDFEEAYGRIAMMNVSADHVVAVKAAPGSSEKIMSALQSRLKFEQDTFSHYLPMVYEKTQQGKVFAVGDYVFLFILGREDPGFAADAASIEQEIRAAFNS